MVITFLDTGLRLSELVGLKMADAHVDEGYLNVMGKGAKERIVPIGSICQKALQRYIFHVKPEPFYTDQDYLFLALDGKPMSLQSVKSVAEKTGVLFAFFNNHWQGYAPRNAIDMMKSLQMPFQEPPAQMSLQDAELSQEYDQ
jgi:integrase/recombinase XerD